MKTTRKVIAAATICMVLSISASAYAEYIPGKTYDPTVISTRMATPIYSLDVNGEYMTDACVYISGDRTMIPLRMVFEKLGFRVNWNPENRMITLEKLPVYITMFPGMDGYTFAKTAPLKLGKAPEIINGITYVPVEIINQILKGELKISTDGSININYSEKVPASLVNANITSIAGNTVTQRYPAGGGMLNINENTIIEDQQGKAVKIEALKVYS